MKLCRVGVGVASTRFDQPSVFDRCVLTGDRYSGCVARVLVMRYSESGSRRAGSVEFSALRNQRLLNQRLAGQECQSVRGMILGRSFQLRTAQTRLRMDTKRMEFRALVFDKLGSRSCLERS